MRRRRKLEGEDKEKKENDRRGGEVGKEKMKVGNEDKYGAEYKGEEVGGR